MAVVWGNLWRLERALCEITGMSRATLHPPAGACGELTGLLIMRAHHERQGRQRKRVAIPDSVGEAESSGCFRMRNVEVADLYKRVPVGTTVVVK